MSAKLIHLNCEIIKGSLPVNLSWNTVNRMGEENFEKMFGPRTAKDIQLRPYLRDVRKLSTEELEQKLQAFGVPMNQEQFRRETQPFMSAQALCESLRATGREKVPKGMCEDWVWLASAILWERWQPDRPSLEMLDDIMQGGYRLAKDDPAAACDLWYPLWQRLRDFYQQSSAQTLDEFDDVVGGTQSITNWVYDLQMELSNAGRRDSKYLQWLLEFSDEMIALSASEPHRRQQFLRSKAEAIYEMGDLASAEKILDDELQQDPTWGWGWIAWSDFFWLMKRQQADFDKAEEILRRGLAVPDLIDGDDLLERLGDILLKAGRDEEASLVKAELDTARKNRAANNVLRETSSNMSELENAERLLPFPSVASSQPFMDLDLDYDDDFDMPDQLVSLRVGRNEPCPCGSGKKYKKCCGK